MKTIKHTFIAIAALAAVILSVHLGAQAYVLSNTTLNGSVDSSQTTFVLTSASASSGSTFGAPAAGQCYFVDNEFGRIVSMSSTTATVTRPSGAGGPPGTQSIAHTTGSIIFTGACNAFKQSEPPVQSVSTSGGKTSNVSCATQPGPWINTNTGNIWWCNVANQQWTGTNFRKFTYNSVPTAQ